MDESEAIQWVQSHSDDDCLDHHELREAFAGYYGRPADDDDVRVGLWSLLCAAIPPADDDD